MTLHVSLGPISIVFSMVSHFHFQGSGRVMISKVKGWKPSKLYSITSFS